LVTTFITNQRLKLTNLCLNLLHKFDTQGSFIIKKCPWSTRIWPILTVSLFWLFQYERYRISYAGHKPTYNTSHKIIAQTLTKRALLQTLIPFLAKWKYIVKKPTSLKHQMTRVARFKYFKKRPNLAIQKQFLKGQFLENEKGRIFSKNLLK